MNSKYLIQRLNTLFLCSSVNDMRADVTLPVLAFIVASVHPCCEVQSPCGGTSSRHHFPSVGSTHPSGHSSAVHYLHEEEIEPYAMLNYKTSLSILYKWAEGEYKWTPKEINPTESTKATILNSLNLTHHHPTPPLFIFQLTKIPKISRKMWWARWLLFFLDNKLPENPMKCTKCSFGKSLNELPNASVFCLKSALSRKKGRSRAACQIIHCCKRMGIDVCKSTVCWKEIYWAEIKG